MNNKFRGDSTSGSLRILADQIDREESPDFMIVIKSGGDYCTAYRAVDDIFGLLGAAKWQTDAISNDVEESL